MTGSTPHELLPLHVPFLRTVARRRCGNPIDADDLVQETLVRALRSWPRYTNHGNLRGWLVTILHHLHLDHCRKVTRAPRHDDIDVHEVANPEPEIPSTWTTVSLDEVQAVLDDIPPVLRTTFELHARGQSYDEIAETLRIPMTTVGTRLVRARRRIKRLLAGGMTSSRLAVAGAIGLAACAPDPDLGSKTAQVSVVDGDPSTAPDNGAHPQVVGITQAWGTTTVYCTGTMIASDKIITAAHCINPAQPANTLRAQFRNTSAAVRSSLLALNDPAIRAGTGGPTWDVAGFVIHPAYQTDQDSDVDIAILTMASSIPPAVVAPMPVVPDVLPAPFIAGQTGHDRWVGYGADFIGMGNSGSDCSVQAFSPATRILLEVVDTSLGSKFGTKITWLGATPDGSKLCGGDSGGPFVTIDADYIGSTNIPPNHLLSLESAGNYNQVTETGPLIVGTNRLFVAQQALDADGDGIEVPFDTCDKQANPDQSTHDTDGDGWPDINCDDDDDNDGIPDGSDNCPLVANKDQANLDSDVLGDACDHDDDNDLVSDTVDNCPAVANPYQENCNADAERLGFASSNPAIVLGDACDPVPCAPAMTEVRDFVAHKTTIRPTGTAICTTSTGRMYEDFIDILGRVKANASPITTTKLEAWFCGCEASTLDACKAPPWNCALSPTAGTASNSRWRKLTLETTTTNTAVPQPLTTTFSPFNALPNPTIYRWDYQTDKSLWIDNQHLWTPTPNDPSIYGAGTDMQGVLWIRDPSPVGLSAHGSSCVGSTCSMASSYLTQVAPDRAVTLTGCTAIPRLAPARWWSYCAQCGDKFQLPWESLYDPAFLSVFDNQVRLFAKRLDRMTTLLPGASTTATAHFSKALVDAMANAVVVGPSDSIETLTTNRARAIALSLDATKLLGEVHAGSNQFELKQLTSTKALTSRTGFAATYHLRDATLRVAGGAAPTGAPRNDYWRWTRSAGWHQLAMDAQFIPRAAVSTVFGGDNGLYVIDRTSTSLRLVRLDEKLGTGAQTIPSLLAHATDAALFVLADGDVALATTAANRTQLSRLVWKGGVIHVVKTYEIVGELAGAPSVAGRNIAVPLRVTTTQTAGVKVELVPASRI